MTAVAPALPQTPAATATGTAVASETGARGRHRSQRRSVPARVFARIASLLTTLLLVVGIGALFFLTIGPRVFHYRTATMLTGSMVPTINPGDVILDTQEPTSDIAIGQIITYHIPIDDHRVESHRVVWLRHAKDGAVVFRTKGDANTAPDPWTARASTPTVWRVRAVLPVVGSVIRALRQPVMHLLLGIALPAALVLGLLVTIWRPTTTSEDAGADGAAATGSGSQRQQRRDRRAAARSVAEMQRAAMGGDDAGAGREP